MLATLSESKCPGVKRLGTLPSGWQSPPGPISLHPCPHATLWNKNRQWRSSKFRACHGLLPGSPWAWIWKTQGTELGLTSAMTCTACSFKAYIDPPLAPVCPCCFTDLFGTFCLFTLLTCALLLIYSNEYHTFIHSHIRSQHKLHTSLLRLRHCSLTFYHCCHWILSIGS